MPLLENSHDAHDTYLTTSEAQLLFGGELYFVVHRERGDSLSKSLQSADLHTRKRMNILKLLLHDFA